MPHLLIIGYVWPEPNSSAAGSRMMQLISFFRARNYSVTFATTAVKSPYMANLEELGVNIQNIQLNNSSFDDFITLLQPEIVLFDRFMMEEQFGWRVSENAPGSLKILDTEDLHFLRKARHSSFTKGEFLTTSLLQTELAKREIASMYRCDLSLIISKPEIELLKKAFNVPEFLLFYLPFLLPPLSEEAIKSLPSFEERRHFVSIGNFKHEPNWDAVVNLKENIWPLIRRKLPEAELHIYGAYPTQKVNQLHHAKAGFIVKGRAPVAAEVIKNARVLLAPLRFGAGLKGKFIDAMVNGTPNVTTGIGAEGMHDKLPWNGNIEDNALEFAQAACTLYSNESIWERASKNGFGILEKCYNKIFYQEEFKEKLSILKMNLKEHREKNFTGSLLSHHSHQSSRYLSKYIEVKNKLEALKDL